MPRYDGRITVFSPDGLLLQVQYAQEAVQMGSAVVGIRGDDVIVLGVEKKLVPQLQEERTEKKIVALDDHMLLAFAGLRADARVMISRARIECQSHRLVVEDAATIEYIARYIAGMKQQYTQNNGRRPFGISCLIGGFDYDGSPHLFQTEPSGTYIEWKASATGRCEKTMRALLEQCYSPEAVATERGAVKLAIRALLEVLQPSKRNLEVAVLKRGGSLKMLGLEEINEIASEIEKEKSPAGDA